jgi:hypothetical protein
MLLWLITRFIYTIFNIIFLYNYKYYLKIIMKNSLLCLSKNQMFRQQFYLSSQMST